MKKLLLSLFAVTAMGLSAYAADELAYEIVFGCSSPNSSTAITTSTAKANYITSGADNIASVTSTEKVYLEANTYIKFGSSSAVGKYVFTPKETVNATKIVVKAASYGTDTGTGLTINNNSVSISGTAALDYTVKLDETPLTSISISSSKASKGRINLYSISVYVAGSVSAPEIKINPSYNFVTALNGTSSVTITPSISDLSENVSITYSNSQFTGPSSVPYTEIEDGFQVTFNGSTAGNTTGTITLQSGSATATAELTGFAASHEGTETDPFSVKDVIGLNNGLPGNYFVQGIISDKTADNAVNGILQTKASPEDSNLILTNAESDMIPVALPQGAIRSALNIVDNPSVIGKTVIINGSLEAYFGVTGVKSPSSYTLVDDNPGGTPDPIIPEYTVAEALAAAQAGTTGTVIVSGIVTKVTNFNSTYGSLSYYIGDTLDATETLYIYGGLDIEGAKFEGLGSILIGAKVQVKGTLKMYTPNNGDPYPEIDTNSVLLSYNDEDVTKPEAPQGVLTVADAVNDYINKGYTGTAIVTGIITEIAEISTQYGNATYTIKDSEDASVSLIIYRGKGFGGEAFTADDEIAVGGVVEVEGDLLNYNGTTPQIINSKIVSYKAPVGTGIDAIGTEVAPVEYYNLQGVKVQNPVKGQLYIIRQGKKAVKAIL